DRGLGLLGRLLRYLQLSFERLHGFGGLRASCLGLGVLLHGRLQLRVHDRPRGQGIDQQAEHQATENLIHVPPSDIWVCVRTCPIRNDAACTLTRVVRRHPPLRRDVGRRRHRTVAHSHRGGGEPCI